MPRPLVLATGQPPPSRVSQQWITKSRCLKQELRRHQRPPEHQSSRSLRPSEFAESSGSLPRTARSSTCAARCPSATASGVVGTSIRGRLVPIGRRRPTTIRGSRCTEVTSPPDNVRLAHRLCNRRDYEWRTRINAMLGKRMSLEEIAAQLNAEKVPPIHGTNRWTASLRSKGIRFLEADSGRGIIRPPRRFQPVLTQHQRRGAVTTGSGCLALNGRLLPFREAGSRGGMHRTRPGEGV